MAKRSAAQVAVPSIPLPGKGKGGGGTTIVLLLGIAFAAIVLLTSTSGTVIVGTLLAALLIGIDIRKNTAHGWRYLLALVAMVFLLGNPVLGPWASGAGRTLGGQDIDLSPAGQRLAEMTDGFELPTRTTVPAPEAKPAPPVAPGPTATPVAP